MRLVDEVGVGRELRIGRLKQLIQLAGLDALPDRCVLLSRRLQRLLACIQLVLDFAQTRLRLRLLSLEVERLLLRGHAGAAVRQIQLLVLLRIVRRRGVDLHFEPPLVLH